MKSIEECISTTNNLRSTVNKVFQALATNTGVKSQSTADAPESTAAGKGASIIQTLKKNLVSVNKVLR